MDVPGELSEVLIAEPHTLSGAVRFRGTRVPVQALLDTLAHGLPMDDFLEDFPDVTAAQAHAVVIRQQNESRQAFGLDRAA